MSTKKDYGHKNGGKGSRFIKIDYYILTRKAWLSLKPTEVRVWLLLVQRFNGGNNGRISLSIREAAKLGKMAPATAHKALKTLIEKGFVICRYKGSFSQKVCYASEYELTHLRYGEKPATKEFASWKPKETTVSEYSQCGIKLDTMSNENVL